MPIKFADLYKRIQSEFFSRGWLLPTLLPASQIGGRALFNILDYSYALWGFISCKKHSIGADRGFFIGYFLILVVFFLSIIGAQEVLISIKVFLQFILQSSVGVLTLISLRQNRENLDILRYALGFGGLLMLFFQYISLLYYLQQDIFDPQQLREGNLPFLLPFILAWVVDKQRLRHWRKMVFIGITLLIFAYILASQTRSSLLAAISSLSGFGILIGRWPWRRTMLLLSVMILFATVLIVGPLSKISLSGAQFLDLHAISSGRTLLWEQALKHPPEQLWLGVGIGNEFLASQVLTFKLQGQQHHVKHFHNILLDTWYETGLLGLSTLVFFIGYVLVRTLWNWYIFDPRERETCGLFMIALIAIFIGSMLDFNHTSRYFSCYFFLCLGTIHYIATYAKYRSLKYSTAPDKQAG